MINGPQRRSRAAPHAPARRGPTLRLVLTAFGGMPRPRPAAYRSPEPLPGHEIRLSGMLHRHLRWGLEPCSHSLRQRPTPRRSGWSAPGTGLRLKSTIGAAAAAFAERCGFEPKAGRMQCLPGEAGALAGVLFGVDEPKAPARDPFGPGEARDIAARRRLPVRQPARGRRSRRARLPARRSIAMTASRPTSRRSRFSSRPMKSTPSGFSASPRRSLTGATSSTRPLPTLVLLRNSSRGSGARRSKPFSRAASLRSTSGVLLSLKAIHWSQAVAEAQRPSERRA